MAQDVSDRVDSTLPNTDASLYKPRLKKKMSRLQFTEMCPGCQCVLPTLDMNPLLCAAVKGVE